VEVGSRWGWGGQDKLNGELDVGVEEKNAWE
jgi:hypothetical protein